MNELDIFTKMSAISEGSKLLSVFGSTPELEEKVARHKALMKQVIVERPSTARHFKIGVYIRYFNQTRHEDYIKYHIQQFEDTIALCPNWELVGFYVDVGAVAPHMETAPDWNRLLEDCMTGKVDLIITQKISNISSNPFEVTFCSRLLAAQRHPIGIYFISEDLFTLASYYLSDLRDPYFLPGPDWKLLPDDELDVRGLPE